MKITLLTGGSDRPYAFGIVTTLVSAGISVDFIGSDEHIADEVLNNPRINFLNLRGDTDSNAPIKQKMSRILNYYLNILKYTATTDTKLFHILWANRFIIVDRLLINLYYKLFGKKLVLTAHNVNDKQRDGGDNRFNRWTLRCFYALMDHIFVHTEKMKLQLLHDFNVPETKVSVIPFGINNTLPNSSLTRDEARSQLSIEKDEKVLLFFGRVAEYKGMELAVNALEKLLETDNHFRLVVAGKIEQGHEAHWALVESVIAAKNLGNHVLRNIGYIPDEKVELYFKSADVLILPYKDIFQSGVLFLAYSFGLPVIATDVGSFQEDIIEGETGMICQPDNAVAFADTVLRYFDSPMYRNFDETAAKIKSYGNKKHSWDVVGQITSNVYNKLLAC